MSYFIPNTEGELSLWLNNLKTKLPTLGPAAGMSTGDVTSAMTFVNNQLALQNAAETKKAEYESAVSAKRTGRKTNLSGLRNLFTRIKTLPGYTEAIGKELGIVSNDADFDTESFKTTLTLATQPGFVRIKFVKGKSDGVNIYSRLKDETAWQFLARDTHSPYDDHRPLHTAGKSETREYLALGLYDDQEIGLPSDVVSILFGG